MIPNKHHSKKAREYHRKHSRTLFTVGEIELERKQREIRLEAWSHCFGNKTLSQIADEISKKYP